MLRRSVCALLLLYCGVVSSFSQQKYASIDAAAIAIPSAYTYSTDSLADYIRQHFRGEEERIRTVYIWMTHMLRYNVYPTFTSPHELPDEEYEVKQTLQKREGICRQFALLFRVLVEKLGIPAYTIAGYTKNRQGKILPTPHEWCTARVNAHWSFYDPTYGMGYVSNHQFVRSPNTTYFCRQATEMIRTHIPFDPLWQQLEYPCSFEEFDSGRPSTHRSTSPFHWTDSLAIYTRQRALQRMQSTLVRTAANGKGGPLVNYFLQLTQANITSARKREIHDLYKQVAELQSQVTERLERFVAYRKRVFYPPKPEREVRQMIAMPEELMTQADSLIHSVSAFPPQYQMAIQSLRRSVIELSTKVFQQKKFIELYYATPKAERNRLFR